MGLKTVRTSIRLDREDIDFLKEIGVFRTVDYGDVNISPGDVVESHRRMTDKVKEVLDIDGIPVMLGGDDLDPFF